MKNCLQITRGLAIAACLLSACSSFATDTNLYHTNRVFKPIDCTISGVKTAYKIHTMAGRLTSVVGPTNIIVHTNNTFAREYEAVAWGYESANAAWTSVLANFSGHYQTYPTSTYDNVGWIKGTRQAYSNWGGFLWLMQNQVDFQTSPSNTWISPMGVTCRISRVFVRSIGDYEPMQNVVDVGPTNWGVITNFLGSGATEEKVYKGDYNAYYELLAITITPRDKVGCPRCLSSVTYTLTTNSSIPGGVTWSLNPSGLSGGATMTSAGRSATVYPGTLGTNYRIRATANLDTSCFDEAQLTFALPGPITQTGTNYVDTSTNSCKVICQQFSPSPGGDATAAHFCFVQKVKGYVRREDGISPDIFRMYGDITNCDYAVWVIDSAYDEDPVYWSGHPHYGHEPAGNNVYYVGDDPGPASCGEFGWVYSLDFEIGVYCVNEVPTNGARAQPSVGTPFDTVYWDYKVTVTTNGTFTHP